MAPRRALVLARLLARALDITLRATLCGLVYALGTLVLLGAAPARRQAFQARCALALLRGLGATFVKLGQLLGTRPDRVPAHLARALCTLQDDVGPFPFRHARAIVERTLARPLHDCFGRFDPDPIASASIAQVHRAALRDGTVVAVKVRRPGVAERSALDLVLLRRLARIAGALPGLRALDLPGVADELAAALGRQLDLRHEVANGARFRAHFRLDSQVVFPRAFPDLCGAEVLTMTYVAGVKLSRLHETRADPARLARLGLRVLLQMVFADGLVHADLHPGNLLVTPEGKLALLDLGLVAELSPAQRAVLARLLSAWALRDGDGMASCLRELVGAGAAPLDPARFEALRADVIALVGRFWARKLGEVQLGRVLLALLDLARRHRIRIPPELTGVLMAIVAVEGIARQLDPALDLLSEALPVLARHAAATRPHPAAG